MAHICSTMDGNKLALVMAAVSAAGGDFLLNFEGGRFIHRIARRTTHRIECFDQGYASLQTWLTRFGSSAQCRTLSTNTPKNGQLEHQSVHELLHLFIALLSLHEEVKPPPRPPKINHQYLTKISLMAITNSVGAGRSAPKLVNTSLNDGTTKIMITAVTTKATISTEIGYISADLILDFMALGFFHVDRQAIQQLIQNTCLASPASTRLQYRLSKYSGYLRNATESEVPVSTSVRMLVE